MNAVANPETAIARVEQGAVGQILSQRSGALLALLRTQAAVDRFQRVALQAMVKNPDLERCTPESVVSAIFEAAAMGLEPTGAYGGAHLVPYNVNVGSKQAPRWEKRAQLIPDYRGVVALVTRPPSEVEAIEARVVKEGDEFTYQLGNDAQVTHNPSLKADRSRKPTTHVYAVARLRGGTVKVDVMDRAEIERIRDRAKKGELTPWSTDFDEMAKKSSVKRIGKLLPVRSDIREILGREDELEQLPAPAAAPALPAGPTKAARLGQRLRAPRQQPAQIADASAEPAAAESPRTAATEEEPPPYGEPAEATTRPDPSDRDEAGKPAPMKGDPCPLHPGMRLAGGDHGASDLYHSLPGAEGYCRPFRHAG